MFGRMKNGVDRRRDGLFVRHITNVLTARLTPSRSIFWVVSFSLSCSLARLIHSVGSRCYTVNSFRWGVGLCRLAKVDDTTRQHFGSKSFQPVWLNSTTLYDDTIIRYIKTCARKKVKISLGPFQCVFIVCGSILSGISSSTSLSLNKN